MKEGWLRNRGIYEIKREKLMARQFEMIPKIEEIPATPAVEDKAEGEKAPNIVDNEKWYSIDNDNYEVKPIRVTILPEAIKVFGVSTSR